MLCPATRIALALLVLASTVAASGCSSLRRRAMATELRQERTPLSNWRRARHSAPEGAERLAASTDTALPPLKCPDVRRRRVTLLGSSTMVGTLGRILQRRFRRWGFRSRIVGRSSSGLARPDFYDWVGAIRRLSRRARPDVWVIALGNNDFQDLKLTPREAARLGRRRRTWVRWSDPLWHRVYAKRVDRILRLMSGPKRRSTVIFVGPIPFAGTIAPIMGPRVNRTLATRLKAFEGPVHYVDVMSELLDRRGRIRRRFRSGGRFMKAYAADGVHLSVPAMKRFMAAPVYDLLRRCLWGSERGSLPRRHAASPVPTRRRRSTERQPH